MKKCSLCRGSTFFENETTDKINYQLTRVISQSFTFFETITVTKCTGYLQALHINKNINIHMLHFMLPTDSTPEFLEPYFIRIHILSQNLHLTHI